MTTEINGIKFTASKTEVHIVRNREVIDPTPKDVRQCPCDVVKAKFLGYNETEEVYVFDDGRLTQGITLDIATEDAAETIHSTREKALAAMKVMNEYWALEFGREDYQKAVMTMALCGTDKVIFTEYLEKATVTQLNRMGLLMGNTVNGGPGAKKSQVKSYREKLPDVKAKELYSAAKAEKERLLEKFGDAVTMTEREAESIAKTAEKAAKKAAKEKEKADKKAAAAAKVAEEAKKVTTPPPAAAPGSNGARQGMNKIVGKKGAKKEDGKAATS